MSSDEIGGIVRAIGGYALAFAAGKGWIANDQIAPVLAAVAAIATAVWSVVAKRRAAA